MLLSIAFQLSTPLEDIDLCLFFLNVSGLGLLLSGLSMIIDRGDREKYAKTYKKLLERRSKTWNLTVVEDEDKVVNELISNLKRHYLSFGIFSFWPLLYVIIAQSSLESYRVLLGIEIASISLFFVNIYIHGRAEKRIILSAMKP